MQFPHRKESSRSLMALGRYAGARVQADSETSALARLIREPLEALEAAITARNAALDGLVDAEAVRDYHLGQMNAAIVALAHFAIAALRGREHPGYLRLFTTVPSLLVRTPQRERQRVYGELVERAAAPETPAALLPAVQQLRSAWDTLQQAEQALRAAERRMEQARADEATARGRWNVGYRRLHAQLVSAFPTDRDRVEGYFRKPGPRRRPPVTEPAPPVVYDAEPVPREVTAALGGDDAKE